MKSLKLALPAFFLLFVILFSPIISLAQTQTGIFKVGDAIQTKYVYNLHTAPGVVSSNYIMAGVKGTINSGPVNDLGVVWYSVVFETNLTGWITEPFIELVPSTTTPPPTTPPPTTTYPKCITFSAQAYVYLGPPSSTGQDPRVMKDVENIQLFLVERGYMSLTDLIGGIGTFGPKTRTAVGQFLSDAGLPGLTVGGTMTSIHLNKIRDVSCSSEGVLWNNTPSISAGQSSKLVWKIPGSNLNPSKDCALRSTPVDSNWNRGIMGTVSGTRNVSPTSTTVYELICPTTLFQSDTTGKTTVTVGGSTTTPPPTTPPPTTPPPTTTYPKCITFSAQAYVYLGPPSSTGQDPRVMKDVENIQLFLVERGYMSLTDLIGGIGTFGPKTRTAVGQFLSDAGLPGLTVGGTMTSIHLNKIRDVSCSSEGVLWNNTPSISAGQSSKLVWKIPGSNLNPSKDCALRSTPVDSNWNRGIMGTVSGTRNVSPTSTTVYELICPTTLFQSDTTGKTTVTVGGSTTTPPPTTPPPTTGQAPTIDLKANGSDGPVTLSSGQNLQLSWIVTPPTNPTCVLNIPSVGLFNSGINPYGGMSPLDPNHPFYPKSNNTVYTIVCSNSAGSATDSVVVNISGTTGGTGTSTPVLPPTPMLPPSPPPTNTGSGTNPTTSTNGNTTLSVGPGNVSPGGSVTLTWSSTAQSCVGMAGWSGPAGTSPWIGLKSPSGSQTVPVTYPTRFMLICYQLTSSGLQTTRAEVVVSVNGVGTDASVPRVIFTGS